VAELESIRIIDYRMQIREEIFTFFLLYYFLFTQYLYADQTTCHISMIIDSDIAPRPMLTRQRHSQHDSVATSRHDQRRLGSTIASMTWQRHHPTANVASVVPSPAILSSDITLWPVLPWERHHQQDLIATSRHSQRLLGSAIASETW
jgi:hypothetical protein